MVDYSQEVFQSIVDEYDEFSRKLDYIIDVNTLHRTDAKEHNPFCQLLDTPHRTDVDTLMLNEIGRTEVKVTQPVMFDQYNKNR